VARVIAPIAGYSKRARRHVAIAFPEATARECNKIARECCNNFGRTLIENYSNEELQQRAEQAKIKGTGFAALKDAKERGCPVIFVSGHFGNHEVPRRALTAMGYEIGGLYREMSNAGFNAHYRKTMENVSGPVFPQGRKGTLQFVRYLKTGGMATILVDVRSKGIKIDFFGKPASISAAAAEFAKRFDAVVIPYYGKRLDDGLSFDVILGAPIPISEPETMMQQINDALCELILESPGQYFWVHRRWSKAVV